jgi:hypothetical protein
LGVDVWPAASLETIFQRTGDVTDYRQRLGERLVSMVFAPPSAALWRELRYSVGHLDAQTGDDWDLFFVGVPAVAKHDSPRAGRDWSEYFRADVFNNVAAEVHREHERALADGGRPSGDAWSPSGGADLVSLMIYGGQPDWLSLSSVRLDHPGGAPRITLSEAAARQTPWIRGGVDRELSPGLGPQATVADLESALRATATAVGAVAAGVAGNYIYALLESLR